MQKNKSSKQSYLSEVKAKLSDLNVATDDLEVVWQVVRPAIAQSYWNGVAHGASGKVKPKTQR